MIVQNELANHPFGYGDLHTLPCPGLQQANTTFTSFRKCHLKDHECLDKSFLDDTVFALAFFFFFFFLSCEKGLTDIQSQTPPGQAKVTFVLLNVIM